MNMRKVIDYILSLFCKHEYEEVDCTLVYDGTFAPYYKPLIGKSGRTDVKNVDI